MSFEVLNLEKYAPSPGLGNRSSISGSELAHKIKQKIEMSPTIRSSWALVRSNTLRSQSNQFIQKKMDSSSGPKKVTPAQVEEEKFQELAKNLNLDNEKDFELIVEILKKTSQTRNKYDLILLKKSLESVKFLQNIKEEISDEVLDNLHLKLKYEFVPKRKTVFNLGETGKKFYIILKGAVFILLKKMGLEPSGEEKLNGSPKGKNNENSISNEIEKKKEILQKKISMAEDGNTDVLEEINILSDELFIESKFQNFLVMRTLKNGDSFGEIALRQNVARTATILCKEDTHFAVLTRQSYQNILAMYHNKSKNQHLEFLQKISIFQGWSLGNLEQLYFQFVVQNYIKNHVFYREGEDSKSFYFIRSGEVEISKLVYRSEEECRRTNSFDKTSKNFRNMRFPIAILGEKEIFGQEEILNNEMRKTQAKCVSSFCEVFSIKKEAFFSFVKNWKTLTLLKEINKKTKSWHEEHFSDIRNLQKTLKSFPKRSEIANSNEVPEKSSNNNTPINERINSKKNEKIYENHALLDKFHVAGKILDLNKKIENFMENRQFAAKSTHEKMELFSLQKQNVAAPKEYKKTCSQFFSGHALKKKYLKSLNNNACDHILKTSVFLTARDSNLLTLDSFRKTMKKNRKKSEEFREKNNGVQKVITDVRSLKRYLKL